MANKKAVKNDDNKASKKAVKKDDNKAIINVNWSLGDKSGAFTLTVNEAGNNVLKCNHNQQLFVNAVVKGVRSEFGGDIDVS